LQIADGRAFLAAGAAGLRVVDVSEPGSPSELSFHDTPGYAWDVFVSGGRAYVADGTAGLRIVDVSEVDAPREIGRYLPPKADVRGVWVAGPHAYLASGGRGLDVVDVSDPARPRAVGHHDTPRSARGVHLDGSYAYLCDTEWMRVIDVANPRAPREVAAHRTPGYAKRIWVEDGIAYVAAYQAGVLIYELAPPVSVPPPSGSVSGDRPAPGGP